MPYMKTDKKVKAGQMRFILLQQCGRAIIVDDVTEQELIQVFGANYGWHLATKAGSVSIFNVGATLSYEPTAIRSPHNPRHVD